MPPRRLPPVAAPVLALVLVLSLAATARAVDVVTLIPNATVKAPGGQVRGAIQSESPTEVRIRAAVGGDQAIPVDQVAAITYDGQPASLALAESRAETNPAEAVELYKKAAAEAAGKPYVAQAARFGELQGLAQLAVGSTARANEAVAGLEAFVKANPQSRHLGPALEALARLHLLQGKVDEADRDLATLEKIAWAKDRAAVLRAEVLSRRGKADEAVKVLDRLIAAAPKGSARARDARLAKARALADQKHFDQAESLVRDLIKEAPPEDAAVQALAYNTLGDCLRAANKPKAALDAYLHTDILYDKDKEQHARALAEIAQLWRVLKRDDRADEVVERLRQLYPQSPYASPRAARGTQ